MNDKAPSYPFSRQVLEDATWPADESASKKNERRRHWVLIIVASMFLLALLVDLALGEDPILLLALIADSL